MESATQLVHHQGGQSFALNIFSDDQQRTSSLRHFLEHREQILEARNFLFVDEDVSIFQRCFHALGVSHEVRRKVALIELHTFNDFQRGFDGLRFFNGDGAVLADLVHSVSNDLANGLIPVGRDRRDLSDFGSIGDLLGDLLEFFYDRIDRF